MGRFIVKLTDGEQDYYLEWSTIVDAPVTAGMPLADFKTYYQDEYGRDGLRHLDDRLVRVEKYGTSSHDGESPEDMIAGNRAGPDEQPLTLEEIIAAYCRQAPIRGGWSPFEKGGIRNSGLK